MTATPPRNNIEAMAATALAAHGDTECAPTLVAAPGGATIAAAPPRTLARGALVGRYVVLSKLGAGGMGVVYAVHDPELDRKVALKLLHPRLDARAAPDTVREARTRLVREAQSLAKLNHPHIVAVHDVGEHDGAVWLAMEYIAGETLTAWMKARRRTWREALDVLIPAAHGLSAAHEAGLIHRDIKPDNIMLGSDGRVRVMDLGLARALDRHDDDDPAGSVPCVDRTAGVGSLAEPDAQVTRAGALLGTPAYMSPEQFRGNPADARADVFSLCVTMWEALYGERPFAGSTLRELRETVTSGTFRPPPRDAVSRRVPGWLRRVCLRGLAAVPASRFASMHELLAALSRGRRRAKTRKWLAGAAALVVLGGSGVAYEQYDLAQRTTACDDEGASIFEVWNEQVQLEVRDGLIATGVSYAPTTVDKLIPVLEAEAESWREHRSQTCRAANVEGTLDVESLDRAMWCLDALRMEFAALLTELKRADDRVVQKAVTAAADLAPVVTCTDRQVLATLPSPPPAEARHKAAAVLATLSHARAQLAAGRFREGLDQTRAALADAEALGWPPMSAAARQLEGTLLEKTGALEASEAASVAAYMVLTDPPEVEVAAQFEHAG